jgi:hypothetical protein
MVIDLMYKLRTEFLRCPTILAQYETSMSQDELSGFKAIPLAPVLEVATDQQ